jgi:AbrB family looped-hinge helix DNA binding protein
MADETVVDRKGRVVIPKRMRERLGLREGVAVKLTLEEERILVMRQVTPESFIREMEGCIKEGSPVPKINPLELKRIWEET